MVAVIQEAEDPSQRAFNYGNAGASPASDQPRDGGLSTHVNDMKFIGRPGGGQPVKAYAKVWRPRT